MKKTTLLLSLLFYVLVSVNIPAFADKGEILIQKEEEKLNSLNLKKETVSEQNYEQPVLLEPDENLNEENIEAIEIGSENLFRHIEGLKQYNVPIVVGINKFSSDTKKEEETLKEILIKNNIKFAFYDAFNEGGRGTINLAKSVLEELDKKEKEINYIYELSDDIETKINKIAKKIYGANKVIIKRKAKKSLEQIKKLNTSNYYICFAKTPLSLSDDPLKINAPKDFSVIVKDIYVSNGARFIVCLSGNILTMPGLPKVPRAIDFKEE